MALSQQQRMISGSTGQVGGSMHGVGAPMSDDYWGRRFMYRTGDGRIHVLTVPPPRVGHMATAWGNLTLAATRLSRPSRASLTAPVHAFTVTP
jgi:hypothetical protein